MEMVCWFTLGSLIGFIVAEIVIYLIISYRSHKLTDEEFIKKLIEKEGWMGAQEVLNFEYNGKYMRIWRKLYREHIEGEEE